MQKAKILVIFPFLLVFYEITTWLSNDMYLPALPQIMSDLNTSHGLVQLTLTTWFLGLGTMQPILGPVSDRYGRRPILLWGGLVFVISTIVCALSSNIHVLLVARFIQGVATCSVTIAGYASIHELYDQRQAIQTLALMGSITILAPAFGPLIGGFLLKFTSWRTVFWILAAWAIIALALLFKLMPESHPDGKNYPIQLSSLLKTYASIVRNWQFTANTLIACLVVSGMISWVAAGPFLVINTFGYSGIMYGIFQVLVFGCYILGMRFVKYLIERISIDRLINTGLFIALLGGLIAILLIFWLPDFLVGFILSMMIYSFGTSLVFAPIQRIIVESCTDQPMGSRMAVFSTTISIFGVLGTYAISALYDGTLMPLAYLIVFIASAACILRWKS